eukprot:6208172-Amphidinium_carterae.2
MQVLLREKVTTLRSMISTIALTKDPSTRTPHFLQSSYVISALAMHILHHASTANSPERAAKADASRQAFSQQMLQRNQTQPRIRDICLLLSH